MITSRWWYVALAAAVVAPIVYLLLDGAPAASIWTGAIVCAVYAAAFLLLRPHACAGNAAAIALSAITAAFAGILTALDATLAVSQCIAYPVVWVLAGTRWRAVVASLGVAVAVGVGFVWSVPAPAVWAVVLVSQPLSFAFSIVIGLWIWHFASLGDEKSRLLDELTAAQDELAALHRDAGVTAERARMSREVHDTVAQSLTGLVLLGQRARRAFAAGTLDDETLELIETGARDALAETRALVAAAAPVELDHGGIAAALERLAERFERETRIRVSTAVSLPHPLPRDAEVVLLRCAQEGLANVRKHSQASSARVELSLDGATAQLRVSDDGRGFPADVRPGFGLAGLRDRLSLAGGTLDVDGTPSATAITATLPLPDASTGVPA